MLNITQINEIILKVKNYFGYFVKSQRREYRQMAIELGTKGDYKILGKLIKNLEAFYASSATQVFSNPCTAFKKQM